MAVIDDARKALHDIQLVLDALQRGKSDEATRYLQDVELLAARMLRELRKPSKPAHEPASPVKEVE